MTVAVEECRVALVLAGGNALGAYQAGVCQALHEAGIEPQRVVGTSIGAINGAVIAGNAPERRIGRLVELWRPARLERGWPGAWDVLPDTMRRTGEALATMLAGRSGLFAPLGSSLGGGSGGTPAMYDTSPLVATLPALIDFARLNDGPIRYAAMAVDLDSGEDAVFDTQEGVLTPQHLRASSALPPSFPAVAIDGRLYVDGGLSANLPLDPILSDPDDRPTLCIAVDLLPVGAPRPGTLGEVIGRTQDLLFACQSRRSIARWREAYGASGAYRDRSVTLARLVYADQQREVAGKAMDFSPASARLRWDAGLRDGAALVDALRSGRIPLGAPGLTVAT